MDPNQFAIGAGRRRPPYQPQKLSCPNCTGPIPLRDERSRSVVCEYCRTQIELSEGQARAIGAVRVAPQELMLGIGDIFEWEGVRYEVAGRLLTGDKADAGDPEEQLTSAYLLYNPRHRSLWLSSYAGKWSLAWRTRVLPQQNVFQQVPGAVVQTHDGRYWRLLETSISDIRYVDGALPWLAQVGEERHLAELEAADDSNVLCEAEYSSADQELEYTRGRRLSYNEVATATQGRLGKDALEKHALEISGDKPRLRAVAYIALAFGALCLLTALVLSLNPGSKVLSETIPPTGGTVGPFSVKDTNAVMEVEIAQGFSGLHSRPWSYVEGAVLDQNKEYLFGFGDELWSEGGESKTSYDLSITIPEPGDYYLGFKTEAPRVSGPGHPGTQIRVDVSEGGGSSLPFWIAGVLGTLLGVLLYDAVTGRVRQVIADSLDD